MDAGMSRHVNPGCQAMAAQFIPLATWEERPEAEMCASAAAFYGDVRRRRTVREYSDRPVPREVIEQCLLAAGTAPNGANRQPWHFVVITEAATKSRIRAAAETEERAFYEGRAPREWLDALEPLGTGPEKPFLETAPVLIAIFCRSHEILEDGRRTPNYYVTESVGIATGILITGLHKSGLVTLTHTPSPMRFLNTLLGRPSNERAFLILVVGYPADDATVPVIEKKRLAEIATFIDGTARGGKAGRGGG
jgi:nitroreductase